MTTSKSRSLALPEKYLTQVLAILQIHLAHAEVWAYGSRVNGDYYDASDLDLVVRQPDDLSRRQDHLWEVTEAFTESNLPIIVQLVDWAGIPESFRDEITARYVVLQDAPEIGRAGG
jgi:predicted nucleotidyltransferase